MPEATVKEEHEARTQITEREETEKDRLMMAGGQEVKQTDGGGKKRAREAGRSGAGDSGRQTGAEGTHRCNTVHVTT